MATELGLLSPRMPWNLCDSELVDDVVEWPLSGNCRAARFNLPETVHHPTQGPLGLAREPSNVHTLEPAKVIVSPSLVGSTGRFNHDACLLDVPAAG